MKELICRYSERPNDFFKRIYIMVLFANIIFVLLNMILHLLGFYPENLDVDIRFGIAGLLVTIVMMPILAFIISAAIWLYFMVGISCLKMIRFVLYT